MTVKTLIWVHKRHPDHPTIQVGFRHVSAEVADKMIAAECAQPHGTDVRRLKYATTDVAPEVVEPEVVEPEAPKPAPRKRRTYKRRDITAES